MGEAIGNLLPSAIGVALSPVPIIAVILMLATPKAKSNGVAFAVGWVAGLAIVTTAVLLLTGGADDSDSGTSTTVGWLKVALGGLLVLLAAKQWRKRPRAGEEPAMPSWMATIDSFGTGKSFGFGAALSGINPKNLALCVAAGATIARAGLSGSNDVVAVAVFVILGSLTVAGPVVLFLLMPSRAGGWLAQLKDFMATNNAVIMMVVLLVLGAKLIGDGVSVVST